jgi:hypothetical protein
VFHETLNPSHLGKKVTKFGTLSLKIWVSTGSQEIENCLDDFKSNNSCSGAAGSGRDKPDSYL